MSTSVSYNILFGIDIIHRYYLNKGERLFHDMDTDEQAKQLGLFNINNFLSLTPTTHTQKLLSDHQLIFKTTNSGFKIISRVLSSDKQNPFISLDDDLKLEFLVRITDQLFFNYTDPRINNTDGLYYFSNLRLSTEAVTFPLIAIANTNQVIDSEYILSQESKENYLKKLSTTETRNLFGVISISMKSDESTLSVIDATGNIPINNKRFEIIFGNRKTFWRYLFSNDQVVSAEDDLIIENGDPKILITKEEIPLTNKGFISISHQGNELPNPDVNMIKPDTIDENKAYSEIYM